MNTRTIMQVCARLLRCIAPSTDTTTAKSLARDLPALAAEARSLDVEALEGYAPGARSAVADGSRGAKRGAEDMEAAGAAAGAQDGMAGKVCCLTLLWRCHKACM